MGGLDPLLVTMPALSWPLIKHKSTKLINVNACGANGFETMSLYGAFSLPSLIAVLDHAFFPISTSQEKTKCRSGFMKYNVIFFLLLACHFNQFKWNDHIFLAISYVTIT